MVKPSTTNKLPAFASGIAYVIPVVANGGELILSAGQMDVSELNKLPLQQLGVSANSEKLTLVPGPNGSVVALLGVGSTNRDLRALGGSVANSLKQFKQVVFDFSADIATAPLFLLEGFLLAGYDYDVYRGKKAAKRVTEKAVVVTAARFKPSDFERIEVLAQAVHDTRDLVNAPSNDLYPASFTSAVQKGIKGLGLQIQVWDEKALAAEGFGGISAVGKGSIRPPRLVKIDYKPKGAKKHIALVGKGITFDSGGLSLKPAESMVGMKYDMTGAASVYQAVVAVAKLGLPVRVTSWLCLAENMPSGTATRPNDVIKIRNGKTVEVLNTDAEGRLVLADGLSAASEEFPDLIVDVATLTGAATIALGNRYAGLMGDLAAIKLVELAAEQSGELVWHMPLPTELRALLDSDIADLANAKIGNRAGGMLLGGHFLKEFIGPQKKGSTETIQWAHLDIAGPANNAGSAYGHTPKGASGVIVRTLVATAEAIANS